MSSPYATQRDFQQTYIGRRYSDELRNAKPIPKDIRHDVLKLLRKYCTEVRLQGPTPSEASRTTAPARSEASTGTSITDITHTFSVDDRPVQPEPARKPLDSVTRARKALLRKLGACREDCRKRKVKCQLWHHSLYDLLETRLEPGDEEIIEWGIKFDTDSQTPVATSPLSARVSTFISGGVMEERNDVIDQAVSAFNLPSGTPMQYAPVIQETDASLLRSEDVPPRSFTPRHIAATATQQPYKYSTVKNTRMFPLGTQDGTCRPAHYQCEFPHCIHVLPMQDLINHFELSHLRFAHLNEPLRMVCPGCEAFYTYSSDRCPQCFVPSLVERLYGQYFSEVPTTSMQPETDAVSSGLSGYGPYSGQGPNWPQYQAPGSYSPNDGFGYYNNFPCGASPSYGGGHWYFTANSALSQFKRSLLSLPSLSLRLVRSIACRRKYAAALMITVTISLVLGYTKYNCIVSNLVQLMHGVTSVSPSKLPAIGVIVASVAFGLHRIVVDAYHSNGIRRGGWLSRCALDVFNVACGRRQEEGPRHELGHARS